MLSSHPIRKLRPGRSFHTSSKNQASVLFALGALSNSRETQHFNKLSHLSRIEHSPPLKLIKTGEVDAFPLPEPAKALPPRAAGVRARSAAKIWDDKALRVGRAILSDNARHVHRLHGALQRAKRKQSSSDRMMQRSLADWAKERQKMHSEMRQAGIWILAAVGTATGLAMWRFWPQNEFGRDSGELGRKIAARAKSAIPLPAAKEAGQLTMGDVAPLPAMGGISPPVKTQAAVAAPASVESPATKSSWWQNLFWKQR